MAPPNKLKIRYDTIRYDRRV